MTGGECVNTAFMKKKEKSNDNPSGVSRQKGKFKEILGNHGQGQDHNPALR